MFSMMISYGKDGTQKCALLFKERGTAEKARFELANAELGAMVTDDFGHEFSIHDPRTNIIAISLEDTDKSIDHYVDTVLRQTRVQVRAALKARQDAELSRSPLVNPNAGGLPIGTPFMGR